MYGDHLIHVDIVKDDLVINVNDKEGWVVYQRDIGGNVFEKEFLASKGDTLNTA